MMKNNFRQKRRRMRTTTTDRNQKDQRRQMISSSSSLLVSVLDDLVEKNESLDEKKRPTWIWWKTLISVLETLLISTCKLFLLLMMTWSTGN